MQSFAAGRKITAIATQRTLGVQGTIAIIPWSKDRLNKKPKGSDASDDADWGKGKVLSKVGHRLNSRV